MLKNVVTKHLVILNLFKGMHHVFIIYMENTDKIECFIELVYLLFQSYVPSIGRDIDIDLEDEDDIPGICSISEVSIY